GGGRPHGEDAGWVGQAPPQTRAPQDAAGGGTGARWEKRGVTRAPFAALLANPQGRAGDDLAPAIMNVLGRRLLALPIATGVPMAPDHGHLIRDDAADVERRPIARAHVLHIEFPEPEPVVTALVSVPVQIEE